MTPTPCPHCKTMVPQARPDGRCVACGRVLPESQRAQAGLPPVPGGGTRIITVQGEGGQVIGYSVYMPPTGSSRTGSQRPLETPVGPSSRAPWLGDNPRLFPVHDVPDRQATLSPPGRASQPIVDAQRVERLAPIPGIENAVPWPVPIQPGGRFFSFWGSKDGVTQPFDLAIDAVLRTTFEWGPFSLRVLTPDGSEVGSESVSNGPGFMLDSIPMGGTFILEVRTQARWGITVIQYMGEDADGPKSWTATPHAEPRRRWWQFW